MLKKVQQGAVLACAVLLAGCATTGGRNYQTDIDALNARVTALQGQLALQSRYTRVERIDVRLIIPSAGGGASDQ